MLGYMVMKIATLGKLILTIVSLFVHAVMQDLILYPDNLEQHMDMKQVQYKRVCYFLSLAMAALS